MPLPNQASREEVGIKISSTEILNSSFQSRNHYTWLSMLGSIFLLVLSGENVESRSHVAIGRSEKSLSTSTVPLGLWKREKKPPNGTEKTDKDKKPKKDESKPKDGNHNASVPACPGAPSGVFSLLPSALKLPSNAGITCHNSTENAKVKRAEKTGDKGKPSDPKKAEPQGAEKMNAEDCVCAFNLLQQSLFEKFEKSAKSDPPKNSTKTGSFTYKWKNGEAFGKACSIPATEKVEKCDPKKKDSCANVESKLKSCATVKSCTVKITAAGKSELNSLPVQTALTDLHYGFQSYAWSCCPLNVSKYNAYQNSLVISGELTG
ncbi:uncharacterized protein MELLADRAFT_66201 [Melampsora larici-populina 98AG31]|uniref:Uncharacterized protein n=1 Tax=Melampsora larici-populina (strain 98AG31 / pathotype 3-4-7) TaxID=747676 RepID=F4RY85_MELLP|nr:uncharacterized protein MELLADRAFT_66201 [Melampsora larici-populina 98AG31]EGG02681.1 hypothetical protein MELLADRAFT_66201 [Melampsora larici-populina 98AG31]